MINSWRKLTNLRGSFIFLYTSISYIGCNFEHHELDLEKGRSVYRQQCSSCHNYQKANNDYYPSLYEMIQMDPSVLKKKLSVNLIDSLHKAVIRFSDKRDMANLKHFLTNYDGIDY